MLDQAIGAGKLIPHRSQGSIWIGVYLVTEYCDGAVSDVLNAHMQCSLCRCISYLREEPACAGSQGSVPALHQLRQCTGVVLFVLKS